MRSIHHEAERRHHRDSKFLKPLSDKQRDNLATLRGQQAESTWNLLTGANRQSHPNANKAWNARNKQALRKSNNFVAKHGEVDPREIDKIFGAANSLASNFFGFPRGKSDDPDYQQGQQAGDDLSSALSTALMISGGGMILQGGELVVSSPVLLALPGGGFVIAPGVAGVGAAEMTLGAGLAGYGSVVKQRVNNNNRLNFEGKGKGGGKNAAHANQKARQAAQKNYKEAQRKLKEFEKTNRGKKGFGKTHTKLKNQAKHWKKQVDFKGENHSQKAKGS